MSVLVYAESPKGQFKKTTYEVVTYGKKVADALGTECHAIVLGPTENPASLGKYGAAKVHHVNHEQLGNFDSQVVTKLLADAAQKIDAKVIILSHTANGKSVLGRLAARLNAGSVSGVTGLPDLNGAFKIKKNVFSGKAIAEYEVTTDIKVISLIGNSIPPEESGADCPVEALELEIPAPKVKVRSVNTVEGKVPLPEAELVVSGGRGFKGPEHFGILEELAETLGATTACSRPVADADWRPHHEHVGQTGIAIRPNLYIAIGISGAIQHLAGVNKSKVIVVINKDPEAPFFKAADYGVVGDLFDVVPRLTEAIRNYKG